MNFLKHSRFSISSANSVKNVMLWTFQYLSVCLVERISVNEFLLSTLLSMLWNPFLFENRSLNLSLQTVLKERWNGSKNSRKIQSTLLAQSFLPNREQKVGRNLTQQTCKYWQSVRPSAVSTQWQFDKSSVFACLTFHRSWFVVEWKLFARWVCFSFRIRMFARDTFNH